MIAGPFKVFLAIVAGIVVAVVVIGTLAYIGNRIDFSNDGGRWKLSERQKAVQDATRPCPGGRALRVKLDQDDVDYDVDVVCAPGGPR
jgi:hypothetical protein